MRRSRLTGRCRSARLMAICLIGWIGPGVASVAQKVHELATPGPVDRIVESRDAVFVHAGEQWLALRPCGAASGLCPEPVDRPASLLPAPADALPDGRIAVATTGDIRSAWYTRPTGRYAHGVLGDAIEGGALAVSDATGAEWEHVLPDTKVFEDITPRIADLDGDGRNEVVAIRASLSGGASVAIYGLVNGRLELRAAGSENGRPNRWLNIAGLMPRTGGGLTVYGVRTPHIGGRLFALDFEDGRIAERNDIATDVSNHVIGSRELGLSATGRFGGRQELVLPSQDRRRLKFPISTRADIPLPGAIDHAIALIDGHIVTATENGVLLSIQALSD